MKCNKKEQYFVQYFLGNYLCSIMYNTLTNIALISLITHIGHSFQFRHILHTTLELLGLPKEKAKVQVPTQLQSLTGQTQSLSCISLAAVAVSYAGCH